ncbi:hypothetical protein BURPS1710b_A1084 [Burkholderia pseudomallei 1710b]|uniref:Uncharacterized protein n=1 Tax=Burkholderia pseudomallei (strain 1710b) TaxID=320372 RepID=Q3JJL1_BURP1|nr:hypothetical protein BURPS1710b_A1084 [Burkholderia pseudomallei 1710b]
MARLPVRKTGKLTLSDIRATGAHETPAHRSVITPSRRRAARAPADAARLASPRERSHARRVRATPLARPSAKRPPPPIAFPYFYRRRRRFPASRAIRIVWAVVLSRPDGNAILRRRCMARASIRARRRRPRAAAPPANRAVEATAGRANASTGARPERIRRIEPEPPTRRPRSLIEGGARNRSRPDDACPQDPAVRSAVRLATRPLRTDAPSLQATRALGGDVRHRSRERRAVRRNPLLHVARGRRGARLSAEGADGRVPRARDRSAAEGEPRARRRVPRRADLRIARQRREPERGRLLDLDDRADAVRDRDAAAGARRARVAAHARRVRRARAAVHRRRAAQLFREAAVGGRQRRHRRRQRAAREVLVCRHFVAAARLRPQQRDDGPDDRTADHLDLPAPALAARARRAARARGSRHLGDDEQDDARRARARRRAALPAAHALASHGVHLDERGHDRAADRRLDRHAREHAGRRQLGLAIVDAGPLHQYLAAADRRAAARASDLVRHRAGRVRLGSRLLHRRFRLQRGLRG